LIPEAPRRWRLPLQDCIVFGIENAYEDFVTRKYAGLMPGRTGRGHEAKPAAAMRRKWRASNTLGILMPC